jgi:hypothetical protein
MHKSCKIIFFHPPEEFSTLYMRVYRKLRNFIFQFDAIKLTSHKYLYNVIFIFYVNDFMCTLVVVILKWRKYFLQKSDNFQKFVLAKNINTIFAQNISKNFTSLY